MPATARGKPHALALLMRRRAVNARRPIVRNQDLPAGAPMYFRCLGCGDDIVVSENWLTKPDLCVECAALHKLGWLE